MEDEVRRILTRFLPRVSRVVKLEYVTDQNLCFLRLRTFLYVLDLCEY